MLDEYRSSFSPAYEYVVGLIHNQLGLTPTGRQIKTTESIVAQLRRQKIRLSRMQDIAGCRVTVANAASQEQAAQELSAAFDNSKIIDRRKQPSHGYRAIHVLVKSHSKLIEVQIRTELQHLWAELSEKL